MVVEGDTRADDVYHRCATMADGGLEQCLDLTWVACDGACDETAISDQRLHTHVDWGKLVEAGILELLALVGSGRELALGQAIDAVVFNDIDHRHVATHQMLELAHANATGIAVTADTDCDKAVIGQRGAGGQRRHAPM